MTTQDGIDLLLTRRVYRAYGWTRHLFRGLSRRSFMRVPAVTEFVEEWRRQPFGVNWDMGRVRYFIEYIEAGGTLTPIVLDNFCSGGHIYPELRLIDGHHRLIAAKVAHLERIPSLYSGRVDLLDYLSGKRRCAPKT